MNAVPAAAVAAATATGVDYKAAFEARLAESGLDAADAVAAGIRLLTDGPAGAPTPAVLLQYYDITGAELYDCPQDPSAFYRLRRLRTGGSFSDLTNAKHARYWQPPGTKPHPYLCPLVDWSLVAADPAELVIITEGEFKAAAGCKAGRPTIGLGGVQNFQSLRHGILFLPELDDFVWARRRVVVVFDSDVATNPQVLAALAALTEQLQRRGAVVGATWLPLLAGQAKTGLDDYLVQRGLTLSSLDEVIGLADPVSLSAALFKMNERFVYVANPGVVWDRQSGRAFRPSDLAGHLVAAETALVRTGIKPNSEPKFETKPAGDVWLHWPMRRCATRFTYAPGQPEMLSLPSGGTGWNLWHGWGCLPAPGTVEPFLALIDHLFTGPGLEDAKRWYLQWLAFPLQYPGMKLFTSAMIFGLREGTGKSLVGYTMQRIYGDNFVEINRRDLNGSFNEWAANRQFVLGDDVLASASREDADMLKKLVTQQRIRINEKFVPSYDVPDCLNYNFTSNHPDALYLADDDRRMFVHEVLVGPKPNDFYVDYALWLDSGGASALFDWFLRLDTRGFDPAAPALRTVARDRMIQDGLSDLGDWTRQLLADPESILVSGRVRLSQDLFTAVELLALYDASGHGNRVTANGLSRELRRAGAPSVCNGLPQRWLNGTGRLYILRHRERWDQASPADVAAYLVQVRAGGVGQF